MFSLEEKFGRDSLVIAVDFSEGLEIYDAISDKLSKLDIGILGKLVYISLMYKCNTISAAAEWGWGLRDICPSQSQEW